MKYLIINKSPIAISSILKRRPLEVNRGRFYIARTLEVHLAEALVIMIHRRMCMSHKMLYNANTITRAICTPPGVISDMETALNTHLIAQRKQSGGTRRTQSADADSLPLSKQNERHNASTGTITRARQDYAAPGPIDN